MSLLNHKKLEECFLSVSHAEERQLRLIITSNFRKKDQILVISMKESVNVLVL